MATVGIPSTLAERISRTVQGNHLIHQTFIALVISMVCLLPQQVAADENAHSSRIATLARPEPISYRINLIDVKRRRAANPPGWTEYDGSQYTRERGYGWLTDLKGQGWDGGGTGVMILPDGTKASPVALGRLELASWQGTHQENLPIVFRIDLPNAWYKVTCTSLDPDNAPLPLLDQRSIKVRAHDVVFAGASYGAPLKVEGNRLVEGSGMVEVTDGHLRLVVGDPAYAGWTWHYDGPWYRGWSNWFGRRGNGRYATGWYQKIARFVDPGFHSLRLNSLVVEPIPSPTETTTLVFRDFLNRDDQHNINAGLPATDHWVEVPTHGFSPRAPRVDLYKTAIRVSNVSQGREGVTLIQEKLSPDAGIIRYSTRVTLFTGEGSQIHSGAQEAGLLILGERHHVTDYTATFLGIMLDSQAPDAFGHVILRVGNGSDGFRTDLKISDLHLPFKIMEGEYAMSVEHDVGNNVLRRIQINGVDVTHVFPPASLQQRIPRGVFGLRSTVDPRRSGSPLRQFYWYYRVEAL
jgi:hypothetical protein